MSLLSDDEFYVQWMRALTRLPDSDFTLKFKGNVQPEGYQPTLRLSGIGKCARQQFYNATSKQDTYVNNSPWQIIMGYAGQEIAIKVLEAMGYQFSDGEKAVSFNGIPGHTDGIITGLDLGSKRAVWDSKLRAAYAFARLARGDINGEMWAQLYSYMLAENADYAIITAMPFDISAARNSLRMNKTEAPPEVCRIVLPRDDSIAEMLEMRSTMLKLAVDSSITPAREFNPLSKAHATFPCGFCPFQGKCMNDDQTPFMVTPLPDEWREN